MVELYSFRHGESQLNTTTEIICGRSNETPLTDLGIEQSFELGEALLARELHPDYVYASPAVRALDTARFTLLAMGVEKEPVICDDLQELDMGEWAGCIRVEKYTPEMVSIIEAAGKDFAPEGGESMRDAGQRKIRAITKMAEAHQDADELVKIFVFGHGLVTRCVASEIEQWDRRRTFETVTPNTSESLFIYEEGNWHVSYVGQNANTLALHDIKSD